MTNRSCRIKLSSIVSSISHGQCLTHSHWQTSVMVPVFNTLPLAGVSNSANVLSHWQDEPVLQKYMSTCASVYSSH
ncbi:hypothetical protein SLEP1_g19019 [Rubroshorea leprosula]|nr:hypothetical protein SLEP1_g19019 [Rubroshorea leprosula]